MAGWRSGVGGIEHSFRQPNELGWMLRRRKQLGWRLVLYKHCRFAPRQCRPQRPHSSVGAQVYFLDRACEVVPPSWPPVRPGFFVRWVFSVLTDQVVTLPI